LLFILSKVPLYYTIFNKRSSKFRMACPSRLDSNTVNNIHMQYVTIMVNTFGNCIVQYCKPLYSGFEVLMPVTVKSMPFGSCSSKGVHCFRRIYHLHLLGWRVRQERHPAEASTWFCRFLFGLLFDPEVETYRFLKKYWNLPNYALLQPIRQYSSLKFPERRKFRKLSPLQKSVSSLNITLCSPLKFNRRFGGIYRLKLTGDIW
jgi:hypothetical protein